MGGGGRCAAAARCPGSPVDRKSTRLNSSHRCTSYAVVCVKKKIGIKEQGWTFTTNYHAGQPREKTIRRIADIVEGQVRMPGQTCSLHGFVGERPTARGFVV